MAVPPPTREGSPPSSHVLGLILAISWLATTSHSVWAQAAVGLGDATQSEAGREKDPAPPKPRSLQKNLRPRELFELLVQPVAVEHFKEHVSLQEFLDQMSEYYRAEKGMELLLRVDQNAFKEEDPDAPDIMETKITINPLPRTISGAQLLHLALARIPTQNAAFVFRPGYVEITTQERSSAIALLSQRIHVRIQGRPLHLALDDLFDATGVPVVLDTRVGNLARAPVHLYIAKETSLGAILLLVSEMANLKMIVLNDVIFVTTPALAQQLLWEQFMRAYQFPERRRELVPFIRRHTDEP